MRYSLVLLEVTPLLHVAQWVSRAPPHHTLPAFLNLSGKSFLIKNDIQGVCPIRTFAKQSFLVHIGHTPCIIYMILDIIYIIFCSSNSVALFLLQTQILSYLWLFLRRKPLFFFNFGSILTLNLVKIEKFSGGVLEIVRNSSNSVNIGCCAHSSVKICGILDYLPPIKMSKHKHYLIQIASCDVFKIEKYDFFDIFHRACLRAKSLYWRYLAAAAISLPWTEGLRNRWCQFQNSSIFRNSLKS